MDSLQNAIGSNVGVIVGLGVVLKNVTIVLPVGSVVVFGYVVAFILYRYSRHTSLGSPVCISSKDVCVFRAADYPIAGLQQMLSNQIGDLVKNTDEKRVLFIFTSTYFFMTNRVYFATH